MKIVTVVGARPQFVKASMFSRALKGKAEEVILHTGQHYDPNMSELFFGELNIPAPKYNLHVGSGSHAKQTADMLVGVEQALLEERPDMLLVYGDTNSTIAGALAAAKLNIPVCHMEAGLRSFNMRMPEEQNRVLTDHISTLLFAPTEQAVENLKKENIRNNVYNIGDVMCDALLFFSAYTDRFQIDDLAKNFEYMQEKHRPVSDRWYTATIHRAENTDDPDKILEILRALQQLPYPVIFPVHPRTQPIVKNLLRSDVFDNVVCINPVGYLEMIYLINHAEKVITDSGGIQKEAYILQTPCVTVRNQTEWVETLQGNRNILAKPRAEDIVEKVLNTQISSTVKAFYGSGHAAECAVEIVLRLFG